MTPRVLTLTVIAEPHRLKHIAGVVVQSHSVISNIKPRHLLRYEFAAGTRFFSAALAQLDAAADTPVALIHRGEVTTRSKLRWSSVLMGLNGVFVFFGVGFLLFCYAFGFVLSFSCLLYTSPSPRDS